MTFSILGASRPHRRLGGQPGQGVSGRGDKLHRLHSGPERSAPAGSRGREAGQGQGQEGDPSPRDQVRRQALDPSQVKRSVLPHSFLSISSLFTTLSSQQHEDPEEDATHPEELDQIQLISPRTESGELRLVCIFLSSNTSCFQSSAVATMRSPRAGKIAKGISPRLGGVPKVRQSFLSDFPTKSQSRAMKV